MTKSRHGFLFDLDGVLIDSEKEYTRIWKTVNEEYPSGTDGLEYVIKGCTLDKILDDYYPDADVRKAVVDRLYELEALMKYDYLPGAREFLSELKKRSLPAAMVTSSNDDKMRHLDEEIPEMRGWFESIVTADRISHSKPDPEGYLLGASDLGCGISRCAVFEDSLQGVMAGHASGAFVVGVAGTLPRETLAPWCDRIVGNLGEIDLDGLIKDIDEKASK